MDTIAKHLSKINNRVTLKKKNARLMMTPPDSESVSVWEAIAEAHFTGYQYSKCIVVIEEASANTIPKIPSLFCLGVYNNKASFCY